jgi:hypothetical protein
MNGGGHRIRVGKVIVVEVRAAARIATVKRAYDCAGGRRHRNISSS